MWSSYAQGDHAVFAQQLPQSEKRYKRIKWERLMRTDGQQLKIVDKNGLITDYYIMFLLYPLNNHND